jgi:hypothetical protein
MKLFFGVYLLYLFESYIFSQHRKIMLTLTQWSRLQKAYVITNFGAVTAHRLTTRRPTFRRPTTHRLSSYLKLG